MNDMPKAEIYKENFTVIQQNKPYPFEDNVFDFTSICTFEHIPNINECLSETIRILNKKGPFLDFLELQILGSKGYQVRLIQILFIGKINKTFNHLEITFVRALYMFPLRLLFLFCFW